MALGVPFKLLPPRSIGEVAGSSIEEMRLVTADNYCSCLKQSPYYLLGMLTSDMFTGYLAGTRQFIKLISLLLNVFDTFRNKRLKCLTHTYINPEANRFPSLPLLSPWSPLILPLIITIIPKKPFSTQQSEWSFKNKNQMRSLLCTKYCNVSHFFYRKNQCPKMTYKTLSDQIPLLLIWHVFLFMDYLGEECFKWRKYPRT